MPAALRVHVVVHVNDHQQTLEQAELVTEAGFTDVFVINHHGGSIDHICDLGAAVAQQHPELRVGVNHLGSTPDELYQVLARRAHAGRWVPTKVWADDARAGDTQMLRELREHPVLDSIEYFGGVAFKYTASYTDNPDRAARQAVELASDVDVVTTSGPGTALAAGPLKVQAMREAIGDRRLALASGVSAQNLDQYTPWVTDIIIASSLETEPYSGHLIPARLAELRTAAQL